MPLPGRRAVLLVCALALLAAAVAGRVLGRGEASSARTPDAVVTSGATDPPAVAPAELGRVTVHVAGAVRRPGVYELPVGARALDAVRKAGGASRRADLSALNLAALVVDGEQIVVPSKGAGGAAAPPGGGRDGPPAIIHLNGADVDDLDTLPGVGPALAERIVAFGRENGGFRSVDDLLEVPGIGPGRLEAIRPLVAP